MVRRTKQWYSDRLSAYFGMRYGDQMSHIPHISMPTYNKWIFNISHHRIRVVLTCDDNDNVRETRESMRSGRY